VHKYPTPCRSKAGRTLLAFSPIVGTAVASNFPEARLCHATGARTNYWKVCNIEAPEKPVLAPCGRQFRPRLLGLTTRADPADNPRRFMLAQCPIQNWPAKTTTTTEDGQDASAEERRPVYPSGPETCGGRSILRKFAASGGRQAIGASAACHCYRLKQFGRLAAGNCPPWTKEKRRCWANLGYNSRQGDCASSVSITMKRRQLGIPTWDPGREGPRPGEQLWAPAGHRGGESCETGDSACRSGGWMKLGLVFPRPTQPAQEPHERIYSGHS